ncbi:MAG: hypothetical protein MZV63_22945 [Marinilabiliales bacterium]|nr:hypothetical protein [Marinilabiliales bacterium]
MPKAAARRCMDVNRLLKQFDETRQDNEDGRQGRRYLETGTEKAVGNRQ